MNELYVGLAEERKAYAVALELARQAAHDACCAALKAIGVGVSDRLKDSLHRALEDM